MRIMKFRPASRRLIVSVLAVVLSFVTTGLTEAADQTSVRIESELEASLRLHGEATVLIDFAERPDLSPALTMDWEARGHFVVDELRSTAERTQGRVRSYLDAEGLVYQSFWIDNLIVVP